MEGTCQGCLSGYQLNGDYCEPFCVIANCNECNSEGYCSSCSNNLAVNAEGDGCVLCTLPGCAYCSANNTCWVCNEGFTLTFANTCVQCQVDNCDYCETNNVCAYCAGDFSPNANGQCALCLSPCNTCNDDGSCLTCVYPYSQGNLAAGTDCYLCDDPACLTCSSSDTTICQQCESGYSVVDGACNYGCNQTECLSCPTDANTCTSCDDYYFVNGTVCSACPNAPQCLVCNATAPKQCITCSAGFFNVNGTCQSCPSFCASCSSATLCLTLVNPIGFVLMTVNGASVLAACDPGCIKCSVSDPAYCTSAADGYYITGGVSTPCTLASNCQTCSQTTPAQCLTCFPGAFLNGNNVCVACSSPCLTCLGLTQLSACTSCPAGYNLNNNQCQLPSASSSNTPSCDPNCANCVITTAANGTVTATCKLCLAGLVLSSGNCVPCLAGCNVCSSTSFGTCLSCAQGNYLNTLEGNICTPCSSGCFVCNDLGCLACSNGYFLTENFECQQSCLLPCATCSPSNPALCTSCVAGYSFNSKGLQNCVPQTGCSKTGNCTVCPFNYKLIFTNTPTNKNQTCLACNAQSNCARCTSGNVSVCTSCLSGSYLNPSGVCVSCTAGCSSCLGKSICLICATGYIAQKAAAITTTKSAGASAAVASTSAQVVNCVACKSPCLTCTNAPSTCLTCISGYSYQGNQCVTNFNFGVQVVLGATSTVFYQNYLAFLKQIANSIGQSIDVLTVGSLKFGSSTVNLKVSTTAAPGSSAAMQQQNQIQGAVTGSIANMPVTKSSVTSTAPNTPASSTDSGLSQTTIIILATVIPIGTLRTRPFIQ